MAAISLVVVLQPGVPGGAAWRAIVATAVAGMWVVSSRFRLAMWLAPMAALAAWALALAAPYGGIRATFAFAALATLLATRSGRAKAIVGGLGLAAALASSSPTVRARIESIAAPSASSQRVLAWSVAVATLSDQPWGVGLGNFPALAAEGYERLSESTRMPPNSYAYSLVLSAWVEAGPIGLLDLGDARPEMLARGSRAATREQGDSRRSGSLRGGGILGRRHDARCPVPQAGGAHVCGGRWVRARDVGERR